MASPSVSTPHSQESSQPQPASSSPSRPASVKSEVKDVLITFCRAFGLGLTGKTLLNLLGVVFNRKKRTLAHVLRAIDKNFALFLGFYAASQKGLYYIFRRILGNKYGEIASVLSGALSGLSLTWIKDPIERVTYALYMVVRGLEGSVIVLADKGFFPPAITNYPHIDTVLMSLTAGQIIFAYCCEPDTLSPSYLHFLKSMGIDQEPLNVIRDHAYKLDDSKDMIAVSEKLKIPMEKLRHSCGSPNYCQMTHGPYSCFPGTLLFLKDGFKRSAKLYGPVHTFYGVWILISKLIKKPTLSELITALKAIIPRTLLNIFWSSVFLTWYRNMALLGVCAMNNLKFEPNPLLLRVWLMTSGLPVLFEYKSRRYELAMYCLPRALESAYRNLVKYGWAPHVSHGEILLFCLGSACMIHTFQNHESKMKPTFKTALRKIIGPYQ